MTSSEDTPRASGRPAGTDPSDPIEYAAMLAERFSSLSVDLAALRDRARLSAFFQGVFLLGSFFKENPDAYRRFKNEAYWSDVRQRPNDRNIMRSVLGYTMSAKERGREGLQNRVYKYARVLEYLHVEEIVSDEVPQRLKEGGGVDAIYRRLCREARQRARRGISLEITAELPSALTGQGATDLAAVAVQDPSVDRELGGRPSDDNRRGSTDEGPRNRVRLLVAANDPSDTLTAEFHALETSKRGQQHRSFRKVILEVEMFEFQLEEVLQAKRATICANVAGPNTRGWRPVLAQDVFTSSRTNGPWPGWPASKHEDDGP